MFKVILSIACLLSATSFAQPVFTWADAHTKENKAEVEMLPSSTGFYIKSRTSGTFNPVINLEYYDENLKRIYSKNISATDQEDHSGLVYYNSGLYTFNSLFTKSAQQNVLSAKKIEDDGSLGTPVTLGSIPADKISARGNFRVASSPDGKNLAIVAIRPSKKEEPGGVTVNIYKNGFTSPQAASFVPGDGRVPLYDVYINNNGIVYLVSEVSGKGIQPGFSVKTISGTTVKDYALTFDGKKESYKHHTQLLENGDLALGGYYTEEGKVRAGLGTALRGAFMMVVKNDGSATSMSSTYPFEKRKNVEPRYIYLLGGRVVMAGEEFSMIDKAPERDPSKPLTSEQLMLRDYEYYGFDIYVDGFTPANGIVFSTTLKKDMRSKNDQGGPVSFMAVPSNGKLHIFYNDDSYRYAEKKKWIVVGGSKVVVQSILDPVAGVASAPDAIDAGPAGGKQGDMLLRPGTFLLKDGSIIVRGDNPKFYRAGKLVL